MSESTWVFLDNPDGAPPKMPEVGSMFMAMIEERPFPAHVVPVVWRIRAERFEVVNVVNDREVRIEDLVAWRPLTTRESFYFGTLCGELHELQERRMGRLTTTTGGDEDA